MKYAMLGASIAAFAATAQAGSFFSEEENNDTIMLANDIGTFSAPGGAAAVDGILSEGDVDFFSFTLTDNASLGFFAAFSASSGDGMMQLISSGGDVIAFDDDSGAGLMPAIQMENLSAGTYYIAFSGFGDVDATSVDSDEIADGRGHTENFAYKLSVGFSVVPAPGALALMGTGGLVMFRRRR